MSVAFPDSGLPLIVQAAFGADRTQPEWTWQWTDLSSRLLPEPITITRGTRSGATSAATSSGTVHLLNDDGELTPHRAESSHWPNVDVGVPMRILASPLDFTYSDAFTRTVGAGGWGTATSGQAWTAVSGSTQHTVSSGAGRQAHPDVNVLRAAVLDTDIPAGDCEVLVDVSVSATATGASIRAGVIMRYTALGSMYLAELQHPISGDVVIRFWRVDASGWTELASTLVDGVGYAAGVATRMRVQAQGHRLRARVWPAAGVEPTTWTLGVDDSTHPTGGVGLCSYLAPGNTNTLPVTVSWDNLAVTDTPSERLAGEADWQPSYLPLGEDEDGDGEPDAWSKVAVTISGISRRLERGEPPALSPLRRSIQQASTPPIAYWPIEDAELAVAAASALPGQPAMTVSGPVVFASAGLTPEAEWIPRRGSHRVASLATGGRLSGVVPATAVTDQWSVTVAAEAFAVAAGTTIRLLEWTTPGSLFARWVLSQSAADSVDVTAYDDAGAAFLVLTSAGIYGGLIHYQVAAHQVGADVHLNLWTAGGGSASSVQAGVTLARVQSVRANPLQTNVSGAGSEIGRTLLVGHIRVHDNWQVLEVPRYISALTSGWVYASEAWARESALERLGRLCDEERIPLVQVGVADSPTALGPQQAGTFNELLDTAEDAESGAVLYELGQGYAVRPRSARYNLDPTLTVDLRTYARSGDDDPVDVLAPVLDDQTSRTVWTVERAGGSSATREADAAYIARRGRRGDSATLDLRYDADTGQHASWRVHRDNPDEMRYPTLPLDLAANPDLLPDWLRCDIGHRVTRTNQPRVAGRGDIDQVIGGYTETLGTRIWRVVANCLPYSPWRVGVWDDRTVGRADTDGSTLAGSVTSTATALSVATTNASSPKWTTSTVELPFDLNIGGEQIRVVAVGTLLNGNSDFETDLTGWTGNSAALTRSSVRAHLGSYSMLITPAGGVATVGARATAAAVTAGTSYTASAWVYSPAGWADVRMAIDWYTAGAVFLSTGMPSATAVAAGVWTHLTATLVAPATAALAELRVRIGSTPAASDVLYADEARLILPDGTSPQTMTVERSINDVIKGHNAGADVRLWTPAIIGL